MPETQSRTHPLIVIAAIAVIIFSAVGVGVMTGIIPSSISKSAEVQTPPQTDTAKTEPAPLHKKAATHAPKKAAVAEAPKRAAANEPVRVASAPPAPPRVCANCGSIEAVNVIEQQGE
ncbi:MAG TPA: hypothetical protein VFG44_09500, partial [Burkholderiales bacterium]|nr:hypothetical protein [Burkholderiales bacterium]